MKRFLLAVVGMFMAVIFMIPAMAVASTYTEYSSVMYTGANANAPPQKGVPRDSTTLMVAKAAPAKAKKGTVTKPKAKPIAKPKKSASRTGVGSEVPTLGAYGGKAYT